MARHIVYPSLVKKNLIMGIPRHFLYVAVLVLLLGWNVAQNLLWGFVWGLVACGVGWVLAKFDPDFMDIFVAKYIRIFGTQNPHKHSGNHYYG